MNDWDEVVGPMLARRQVIAGEVEALRVRYAEAEMTLADFMDATTPLLEEANEIDDSLGALRAKIAVPPDPLVLAVQRLAGGLATVFAAVRDIYALARERG